MALPTNADVVVVQGYWWDEITQQGVANASVSFKPVPLGSAVSATKTPNLRDLGASGYVKTRARVASIDPDSGYFATLMVASNDPDLDAYGGREVVFTSGSTAEPPFVVEVPYNASTTTVNAEMADATGLDQGATVRVVWLADAALLTTPTPAPSVNYLTSTQTLTTIADGIEAHEEDGGAHPEMQAALLAGVSETARDALGAALVAGANITITPDDGADTITIAASVPAGYTDEQAQDTFAALIAAGTHSGISFFYNDASNTLSATVAAQSWSQITGKPTFATVATSGDAADLTGTLADGVIPSGIARDSEVTSAVSAASTTDRARANHTGTQASTTISDFTEAVQDAVAALLGAGSNITLNYDDAGNTLTVTGVGDGTGLDAEAVRDAIGVALVGAGNIAVTVNDALDTITISTTATVNSTDATLLARANHTGTQATSTITGFDEQVRDVMGTALVGGANITITPNDGADTITIAASGGGTVDSPDDIGAQPVDADLTDIAGLTHANDTILQTKSGAWAARTPAQVRTDLGVSATRYIDVKDYGALGDGTTSDTTAISNAMDAANTAGAVLYFPPGTYVSGAISKSYAPRVTAQPGTVTILAGATSGWLWSFAGSIGSTVNVSTNIARGDLHITVASTTGLAAGDLIRISDTQASYATQSTRTQGQTVEIVSVDSGTTLTLADPAYTNFTTAASAVIAEVTAPAGGRVSGIKLVNTNSSATVGLLRLTYLRDLEIVTESEGAGAAGVRFEHCYDFRADIACRRHFDGGVGQFGYGVEINGACAHGQLNVRANRVRHAVSGSGIDSTPGEPVNIRITGVAHGTTGHAWDFHAQGSDIVFADCHAYGPRSYGFALRGKRQHIHGGIVEGGFGGAWLFEAAISNRIDGLRVSNVASSGTDDASGAGGRGIRVQNATSGLTITNCEFVDIARQGIVLDSTASDLTITGNVLRNVGKDAFSGQQSAVQLVGAVTRGRVRDNTITDNQGSKTTLTGLTVDATCTDTSSVANDVQSGITATGGSGATSIISVPATVDRFAPWYPTGVKSATFPNRMSASTGALLSSGRLTLCGGLVLEAGVTISSITFAAGGTALAGQTNQWFCLVDQSLNILAKTADDTTTAWTLNTTKTLTISGGYTPTNTTAAYAGIVCVGTTMPTLVLLATASTVVTSLSPVMSASANTGLTNPASLTSVSALTTLAAGIGYAHVS